MFGNKGPSMAQQGGYEGSAGQGGYGHPAQGGYDARGDGQGYGGPGAGHSTGGYGGPAHGNVPPNMGTHTPQVEMHPGVAGYEKRIQWQLVFTAGAVMTTLSGVLGVLYLTFTIFNASQWAPCTFLSSIFLTLFGLLMVVLDFPLHRPEIDNVRRSLYTFLLFMTRFCGRGVWYLFLSTHVWVVLYDEGISPILGCIITIFLLLLGVVSFGKGFYLSRRLDSVRNHLREKQIGPQHFPEGLDRFEFSRLIGEGLFTDSELGYVINALSLRATGSDGRVSPEELNAWLAPGPMTIV